MQMNFGSYEDDLSEEKDMAMMRAQATVSLRREFVKETLEAKYEFAKKYCKGMDSSQIAKMIICGDTTIS